MSAPKWTENLKDFLLYRESWIALGLGGFGKLRQVFIDVIGREPREINVP